LDKNENIHAEHLQKKCDKKLDNGYNTEMKKFGDKKSSGNRARFEAEPT